MSRRSSRRVAIETPFHSLLSRELRRNRMRLNSSAHPVSREGGNSNNVGQQTFLRSRIRISLPALWYSRPVFGR